MATRYTRRRVQGSTVPPPDNLILFADQITRPIWMDVNKVTGAVTVLPTPTNGVAQVLVGPSWQPSGQYVAAAYGIGPQIGIYKRTALTALARLTSGVPAWSAAKVCTAWDGDDRLIGVGESSLHCEVASRVGDAFTLVSTPLNVQHATNNFGVAALNGFMILGGNRDGSNFTHRTYAWSGTQYIFGSGYDFGVSNTARYMAISADGIYVAVFGLTAALGGFLRVYTRSGTTLTQVHANLLTGTAGGGGGLAFSPNSQFLYFQHPAGTSPFMQGWKNIAGTWTPISLGVTLRAGSGCSVSPDGFLIAFSGDATTDHNRIYSINPSTGALTEVNANTGANSNQGSSLAFNPNKFV